MFAPPSISKRAVCLTCTYNDPSLLRPNTLGELMTRVMLSITNGKFESFTSRKDEKRRKDEGHVVGVVGG